MSADKVFSSEELQLVTFNLGDESFGLDIMTVQEIIRAPQITKVPRSPVYVDGVTNLRGHILPVIDSRTKFGMPKIECDQSTRVIVVDVNGRQIGLNVDSVSEVLRVDGKSIEPAPAGLSQACEGGKSVTGVVKVNQGQKLVMLLSPAELCSIASDAAQGQNTHSGRSGLENRNTAAIEEIQIVSFLLGDEEFGLEIDKVKEIIRYPEIVKVPNAPDYVKGIISLRDRLMPIIDLRTRINAGQENVTESTRIVVVDSDDTLMGLTVDRVFEVMRVPVNIIFPPPEVVASEDGARITGLARLDDGKRIVMLMDLKDLIVSPALQEISRQDDKTADVKEKVVLVNELDEEQMVVFRLGEEQFAVNVGQVQEINRLSQITKVPRAPKYVEGVVNLRGDVIPVIDLRKRFELATREYNQFNRIIVSDFDKKKVGIIVDEVIEVLRVPRKNIEQAPDLVQEGNIQNYLEGMANLGERMIMMLNLKNILQAEEWHKIKGMGESADNTKGPSKLKKQVKKTKQGK
ncbi:MAG: chemotaxis protein CheW [Syntrophomonadaceae bacterium]